MLCKMYIHVILCIQSPLHRWKTFFPTLQALLAKTRQSGILCGWSGRLEQSTTGHSFGTYIINFHIHAQDTSVLMFLLH